MIIGALVLTTTTATASELPAFEEQYAQAQKLCLQIFYPNSMARPEGTDINAEMARLRSERDALALGFASPAGIKFLVAKSRDADDKEAQVCIVELLAVLAARSDKKLQ